MTFNILTLGNLLLLHANEVFVQVVNREGVENLLQNEWGRCLRGFLFLWNTSNPMIEPTSFRGGT